MKYKHLLIVLIITPLFIFSSCEPEPQDPALLEGSWIGSVSTKPYPDLLHFRYDSSGYARLFYNDVDMHKLQEVTFEEDSVKFLIQFGGFEADFRGLKEENLIRGKLNIQGQVAETNLIKVIPEGLDRIGELVGFFEFGPGHIVELDPFFIDMSLTPLSFTDFRSGSRRVAFPVGGGKFSAGPQMLNPYPEKISFSLPVGKDTADYNLILNDPELGQVKGIRLADLVNQQDIIVKNDGVVLHATVTYPNIEADNYPLVVFVPGAGESTRQNAYKDYIKLLPYYGVATLVYDKRGCGESTGNMRSSTFSDFASDVKAIAQEAAKMEKINAQQIGLLGIDQASYIMPIAAQDLPDLQFIIMLSGSALSMDLQENQAVELRMYADGFNKPTIEEALDYQNLMFSYLNGKADSLTLQNAADAMERKAWSGYVTSFNNKQYMKWWRQHYTYDPRPYLKNLDLPILALYGDQDVLLKIREHRPVLEEFFAAHSDTVSKVITYKNANHFLILGESRGDFQFSEIVGYAPGLFNTINEWVVRRFGLME